MIREVEARGPAEIVVGDNPGLYSYGANEAAFTQTGLGVAAGAYYRNIGTEGVTLPLKTSGFDGTVSVSRAVMAADVVISLPKFKTHGLTVITGAIKNSYGILPGAQKARLHLLAGGPAPFNDTIVDVFNMRWSWPERLFKTNGAWMPPGMEPCLPPRGRQAPQCQTGGD